MMLQCWGKHRTGGSIADGVDGCRDRDRDAGSCGLSVRTAGVLGRMTMMARTPDGAVWRRDSEFRAPVGASDV